MQQLLEYNNFCDATIPGMQQLLGCNNFWNATTYGMQQLLECNNFWNATTSGMQQLLGCNNFWDATTSGMQQLLDWKVVTYPFRMLEVSKHPLKHPKLLASQQNVTSQKLIYSSYTYSRTSVVPNAECFMKKDIPSRNLAHSLTSLGLDEVLLKEADLKQIST
jgi:hypothetical protein